ncbi:thiol-disulfide oxidoreductase DCC family protein [Streptomyces graminilatus]|uniref:thiol-disulfide oxidoreductase DCC family protein n=1 Tax=Streptomyces graminilatus TaxID=1464070 RepID=UPI0007C75C77|nr:DCC1-like thiol-disulfide oxidoreductase family protein [Streptomyces graminilatus]
MSRGKDALADEAVLLFDATCVMCSLLVPWIIEHESVAVLRFAALRSDAAVRMLERHGVIAVDDETMYVIEGGQVYTRSAAVARCARYLRWPWRIAMVIGAMPVRPRDAVYRWVARNRHRWFGTRDACAIPPPSVHQRLLDWRVGLDDDSDVKNGE